jgi:hypothetical protein
VYNDYTCQRLHDAKRRDFISEAEHARLVKQAEIGTRGKPGLRQVRMRGAATVVAAVVLVIFLLGLFVMNAWAEAATPPRSSTATAMVVTWAGTGDSGQAPASTRNGGIGRRVYEKWRSLPAPYNHNVAELNEGRRTEMLTYDTPQATDARAQKEWEQEPAPFNRSVAELNALKQEYRKAAGLP